MYVLWCLSIYEYKPLLLLLVSAPFEFLRPEYQRKALQCCTEASNKVWQIFNEVGVAVRPESATELENPLNLKQKRLLDITCDLFFSLKSLISRIHYQSMLGTAWYSPTELKVCHFLSI